jgi:Uma2 family endonuclease
MAVTETPQPGVQEPRVWPLSVKAYHALGELGLLPESTELLHGQIIQKMSKSPLHTYLQQFLADLLRPLLPAGLYLRPEQPITYSDSELEPDLAVVCGRSEDYRREHPRTAELLIEVCVSSHDFDQSKLRAYASASVKECWLVLRPRDKLRFIASPPTNGTSFALFTRLASALPAARSRKSPWTSPRCSRHSRSAVLLYSGTA